MIQASLRLAPLVLLLLLAGCPPGLTNDDDDDATANDDDATANDDDTTANDDDATADDDDDTADDDDDTTTPSTCQNAALASALLAMAAWEDRSTCSHFLSVAPADGSVRIAAGFQVADPPAPTVGTTWTLTFDGTTPADAVPGTFSVQTGGNLTLEDCNDSVDPNNRPVIVGQWDPISGSATMTVDVLQGPDWPGGPETFTGTVEWSGVVVELLGSAGTTCEIPDATWSNLNLGWLPG